MSLGKAILGITLVRNFREIAGRLKFTQFKRCNDRARSNERSAGQLVTRMGRLVGSAQKNRLPKLDQHEKDLLFLDARGELLAQTRAEASGFS